MSCLPIINQQNVFITDFIFSINDQSCQSVKYVDSKIKIFKKFIQKIAILFSLTISPWGYLLW